MNEENAAYGEQIENGAGEDVDYGEWCVVIFNLSREPLVEKEAKDEGDVEDD